MILKKIKNIGSFFTTITIKRSLFFMTGNKGLKTTYLFRLGFVEKKIEERTAKAMILTLPFVELSIGKYS